MHNTYAPASLGYEISKGGACLHVLGGNGASENVTLAATAVLLRSVRRLSSFADAPCTLDSHQEECDMVHRAWLIWYIILHSSDVFCHRALRYSTTVDDLK